MQDGLYSVQVDICVGIISTAIIYTLFSCLQCLAVLMQHRIFSKSVTLLSHEQSTKIIFNALEGNYALCLLGECPLLGLQSAIETHAES